MNIDINEKYVLRSDPLNLWIEEKPKQADDKKTNKVVTGYCRNFEHLFESFSERKMRAIEAKEVHGLLNELRKIEADLKEIAVNLGKELDGRVEP